MNNQIEILKAIWHVVKSYWILVLSAVVAAIVMLHIPQFQWVVYGFLKLALVCAALLIIRALWYPEHDKFIGSGEYDKAFKNNLTPEDRVVLVTIVNIALLGASVLCFCL